MSYVEMKIIELTGKYDLPANALKEDIIKIIADVKRGCMKAAGKELAEVAYTHRWFDLNSLLWIIKEAEPEEE